MHGEHALFGRNAETEGKPVVSGAAVHVEPIGPALPEAVVGDLREEAHERVGESETHEADLTTVGVPRQHQIRLARR